MPLKTLCTLSHDKPFEYKYVDDEEIIVYPCDNDCNSQREYAIVITSFEQQLVRNGIREAGTITIGASRDNPPKASLGATLKAHDCPPQLLSYLSAILVSGKYCAASKHRKTLALTFNKKAAS